MTERTKLQRKMIAALAAEDIEKAKRIDWDIRCLDWFLIREGKREMQPGDGERFKDVFLYYLKLTSQDDNDEI